jgi:CDP-4-dehydro-6-deoxyglucose reductase, E1
MKYKWNLASDSFTFLDRLKVASFILNKNNILTMGPKVEELENVMTEKYGVKALATSSGSTSNQCVFEIYKQLNPKKFENTLVICPVVSWISNVSPVLMAGYKIQFCDINLDDFSFDYVQLETILEKNKDKNLIIWVTALIGRSPNFNKLKELSRKYNTLLWGDFCEAQVTDYQGDTIFKQVDISTVSMYFSHFATSVEAGFIFFKDNDLYEYTKMFRNHGMTRSLNKDSKIKNSIENKYTHIDKQFLFGVLGSNFRLSDCHAIWGLQDMKRIDKYKKHRIDIYSYFYDKIVENRLDDKYYIPRPGSSECGHVAFCLAIFTKNESVESLKRKLNENGIATRPIIGSCLTLQPCLEQYHDKNAFKNGLWVHERGCYVGLPSNLKRGDIDRLIKILNAI